MGGETECLGCLSQYAMFEYAIDLASTLSARQQAEEFNQHN